MLKEHNTMGTRSLIGHELPNKTVRWIYCHWDGYLSHVGKTLLEHYTTKEKVMSLLDLGNLSSLEKNLLPEGPHSYDKPEKDVVIAYGRDRGEPDQEAGTGSIQEFEQAGEAYNYLFRDGEWFYQEGSGRFFKVTARNVAKD